MKRKVLVPVVAFVLVGAGLFGITNSYADTTPDQYPSIVQKLVSKFNLNESEVKAVFDEDRTERKTQMEKNFEEQLTQLVKDGKITEAQKQLILAKHKELSSQRQSEMEAMKNLTPDERKAKMKTQRTELEKWAKDNGIDARYLMRFGHRGMGRHMGR